ncbi:MAG: nicotinate-nucleotide adenylyltransferase [Clostridiales bacterium]|nr:nicotinate-nucleotide adenylyltransferase [Clostridiales bacterium]
MDDNCRIQTENVSDKIRQDYVDDSEGTVVSDRKHRVGIFGGTFHPIHYGHLIIAENACEQFDLEQVVFMPTGHAPHKAYGGPDMDRHRCRMVELAIADNPKFYISYREVRSDSVNYTYQTLRQLHDEFPDIAFYFILGADSLFDFHQWKHPELICEEAVVLAAVRDDLNESRVDAQIRALTLQLHGEIYRLNTPNFNISSKNIRERIQHGRSIRYLTPDPVVQYIRQNHLYR